ncbi:unnamed protein product [Urochloa decumbens]|uniref:Uncharacterized protein n=1 Tax=Urochloa decumbens TaxID=240449 RepID=A0ABC9H5H0_9POAL
MESAAQSIVTKLGQLLLEEVQDIRGVGDKVAHLTDELATMNAVLRMVSEADETAVDHLAREWQKQVRELAYDAEDCADIYRIGIGRRRPAQLLPCILKWPKHQMEKLWLRRALAGDVNAQVSMLVGIREQADALAETIKKIHDHEDDSRKLKVFSIVGFGGLGKTTLAVELCRRLEADFQRQALVSVSQAFDGGKDMKALLARLLPQMDKLKQQEAAGRTQDNQLNIHQMDVEGLSTKLNEHLKDKRYLIVIDDVWSLPAWEAIRIRLPENNCGSRIIVTTRIETVAKASSVSEEFVHHMKPLEPKASEELFVKRVFGSTGTTCPDGLKDIMSKILKKCGGLPLAIVKIASILAGYNSAESVEMWRRVSDSIGSQMESHPTLEGMTQLIALSYGYLPHHLKACMLYLSIFPEDYVIAKDRLLYRWIAEGLVAEKRGLTSFDVAEEYFNELISRNMIQPDKLPGAVEACRVHDMMLEVMVSRSQEANFVSLVGRQYGGGLARGKVRRLSIHGNVEDEEEETSCSRRVRRRHGGIDAMNLQHVRSLSTFQVEAEAGIGKLLDRLGELRLLRVLDLEGCRALEDKHLRDVCRLYLVRFLGLRRTPITVIPSKIGDLECLESLDVEETLIRSMPPTVTKLSKLERLRVPPWVMLRGLGNMKALREVSWAVLEGGDGVQVAREIGELQQLQVLSILLKKVEEAKEEFSRALASSLSNTYALRTLYLCLSNEMEEWYASNAMDFLLHVSSPPPLLRCLVMFGSISRVPDWISSLKHLAVFELAYTNLAADQLLDSLCELPNLHRVLLGTQSCRGPELVVRTKHRFPALRILMLDTCYLQVVRFEEGSVTKLETLVLTFFPQVKVSIVGVGNLKNLKEVKLRHGGERHPSLRRALQQLEEENENRPKSNQIKIVVE